MRGTSLHRTASRVLVTATHAVVYTDIVRALNGLCLVEERVGFHALERVTKGAV